MAPLSGEPVLESRRDTSGVNSGEAQKRMAAANNLATLYRWLHQALDQGDGTGELARILVFEDAVARATHGGSGPRDGAPRAVEYGPNKMAMTTFPLRPTGVA